MCVPVSPEVTSTSSDWPEKSQIIENWREITPSGKKVTSNTDVANKSAVRYIPMMWWWNVLRGDSGMCTVVAVVVVAVVLQPGADVWIDERQLVLSFYSAASSKFIFVLAAASLNTVQCKEAVVLFATGGIRLQGWPLWAIIWQLSPGSERDGRRVCIQAFVHFSHLRIS